MKLWIGAAVAILAVFVVFTVAVTTGGSGSNGSSGPPIGPIVGQPTTIRTATPVATAPPASAAFFCGQKTCVPTAPTATAPASCGFGSGIWEQCAKTAIDPAFQDYLSRFPQDTSGPESFELAILTEERVDWPDSCLGVDTPGVLCLQVITPGFRFVVTAAPGQPYAEYHTDLNGHAVFLAEYATYQDVPPTHAPGP